MLRVTNIVVILASLWGVNSIPQDSGFGIVGGHDVDISEVPFMARYCAPQVQYCCGASIVSDRYILSAASCFNRMNDSGPTVAIVGTDQREGDGESYQIEESYPHPLYVPMYAKFVKKYLVFILSSYDAVMLRLAKKLEFGKNVQPIQLADASLQLSAGQMLDTMGFGYTSGTNSDTDRPLPRQLQKVTVPYYTPEKCRNLFNLPLAAFPEGMICTGAHWKGPSELDEGGPLVYDKKLLGIVSFSSYVGHKSSVTLYTSIPEIREFIDSVLDKEKAE